MPNGYLEDMLKTKRLPAEVIKGLKMSNLSGKILLADATKMIAEIGWTHIGSVSAPKDFIVRAWRLPYTGDVCQQDVSVHLSREEPSTVHVFDFSDATKPPSDFYVLLIDATNVNLDCSGNRIFTADALPYTVEFHIPLHRLAHASV